MKKKKRRIINMIIIQVVENAKTYRNGKSEAR